MIYAVINQKGGVGKSTTAGALWAGLTAKGFKTLAVDLDAQGNLTHTARASTAGGQATALSLLTKEAPTKAAIQHTENGDIIASSKALAGADAYISATGKEYKLREALSEIQSEYDYIIIDTPPALGILTINALTACNSVIIPTGADIYSLQGISQLVETINPVKQYCNPGLTISGILLTRYNPRTVLTRDVTEHLNTIAEEIGTKVYTTTIREAITIKEAQLKRESLFKYAPRAKVTQDYKAFINELLKEEKAK